MREPLNWRPVATPPRPARRPLRQARTARSATPRRRPVGRPARAWRRPVAVGIPGLRPVRRAPGVRRLAGRPGGQPRPAVLRRARAARSAPSACSATCGSRRRMASSKSAISPSARRCSAHRVYRGGLPARRTRPRPPRLPPPGVEVQCRQRPFDARRRAPGLHLRRHLPPAHGGQAAQPRHRLVLPARQRMAGATGGVRALARSFHFDAGRQRQTLEALRD